ncbi:hypothetical protein EG329_002022 [Mollisiaceae sp. DMI_Dod_QoI]|nr:hypothetical protein EG329_002022 [Helotiales sp. DMI_Dod_QoI]
MAANDLLSGPSGRLQASSATPQPRKLTALERNNLKWEFHKAEIRLIYVDQDKTLKETMQCERKWKEKIKQWKFDKNVPSSDMGFMVIKAEKRKAEHGKDTMFYRSGIPVDRNKLEQFKKRKTREGTMNTQSVPETPPQVAYSTPKPQSRGLSPIREADDFLGETAELGLSSTGFEGENTNLLPSTQHVTPQQDAMIAHFSGDNHQLSLSTQIPGNFSNHGLLQNFGSMEEADAHVSELGSLAEELESSCDTQDIHRRSSTELQYVEVLRRYIDSDANTMDPVPGQTYVIWFLTYLETSASSNLAISLDLCLHVYNISLDRPSKIAMSIDVTFLNLLRRHFKDLTSPRLFTAFGNIMHKDKKDSLRLAFEATLKEELQEGFLAEQHSTMNHGHFRLIAITFASQLYDSSFHSSYDQLEQDITEMKASMDQLRKENISIPLPIRISLSQIDIALNQSVPPESVFESRKYAFLIPSIVSLPLVFSNAGWLREAEAFYSVIGCNRGWLKIPAGPRLQIEVQYCQHLLRGRLWCAALYAVLFIYTTISVSRSHHYSWTILQSVVLSVSEVFRSVPRPLDQYISAEVAQQIMELDQSLRDYCHDPPKTPVFSQNIANDTHEDEEDGMEDFKSSNQYGVTYTESGMTGISFNYSDLWR